jgi:lipopolysaccharide/colanic/teichoic acid biosynthesis glycosyltransferase
MTMGIVKRLIDITISLVGLIALSPLFAVISVLIWFYWGRQSFSGNNGPV